MRTNVFGPYFIRGNVSKKSQWRQCYSDSSLWVDCAVNRGAGVRDDDGPLVLLVLYQKEVRNTCICHWTSVCGYRLFLVLPRGSRCYRQAVGDMLVGFEKAGHDRRFPNGIGLFTLDNTLVGNIQQINGGMQNCLRKLLLELRCLVWTCHVIN